MPKNQGSVSIESHNKVLLELEDLKEAMGELIHRMNKSLDIAEAEREELLMLKERLKQYE